VGSASERHLKREAEMQPFDRSLLIETPPPRPVHVRRRRQDDVRDSGYTTARSVKLARTRFDQATPERVISGRAAPGVAAR
jgi:hypothetical protein